VRNPAIACSILFAKTDDVEFPLLRSRLVMTDAGAVLQVVALQYGLSIILLYPPSDFPLEKGFPNDFFKESLIPRVLILTFSKARPSAGRPSLIIHYRRVLDNV
jgi:hypothetical protein